MSEIKGSTLFIVGSPFQCLCMLEAIDRFELTDYDILVAYCDRLSLDKITRLLDSIGLDYSIRFYGHIIKTVLPLAFERHRYYKNVFLGDYYGGYEALAAFFAGINCRIHYIDDGIQALEIFTDCAKPRYKSSRIAFVFGMYHALFKLKGGKEQVFYTIYPVSSNRFTVIHNSFKRLRSLSHGEKAGVYIIGTNSSVLKFKGTTYPVLLKELVRYVKTVRRDEPIFYCPHRRDTNNVSNYELCETLGISIYNTEISVEYDFAIKGINPSFVIGFTSNALYTLKMIFPDSDIETVLYHLEDEQADIRTSVAIRGLNAVGIRSIELPNGEC